MPLTYPDYLKLDQLLNLQFSLSDGPEHDEMLFIIIHQTYELWFKQLLHELRFVQTALDTDNEADIFHAMKRILSILKTLVAQNDILETMTPIAFNTFRDRLETASGFQSLQFRLIEILLGKRNQSLLNRYPPDSAQFKELDSAMRCPSLWDSFIQFLDHRNYNVPSSLIKCDFRDATSQSEELQAILVKIYRERSTLMEICERLLDLDEGLQEWRYRHVKMVERTIGVKMGTGGSSGMAYLKSTIFTPIFPDLWEIRSSL